MSEVVSLFKQGIKFLLTAISSIVIFALLYINIKLYDGPVIDPIAAASVIKQLRYFERAIDTGAAHEMQNMYPEGYVFMHALYGLTWADFALNHPHDTLKRKAIEEIKTSWTAINSTDGKMPFDEMLPIRYGAFYTGWNNYLLGKLIQLTGKERADTVHVIAFKKACSEIAYVMNKELFPESYDGMRWPADGIIALASLSLHDKIFTPAYSATLSRWVNSVRRNVGTGGLIPHRTDANENAIERARGSSQSLILNFLVEIDSSFAKEQFESFERLFLDQHFGLPFIREYPRGMAGEGDIDSGPVIWNIGSSATIVGARTLFIYGKSKEAQSISACIEAFGFPSTTPKAKHYLFEQLIIADAFIAWTNSVIDVKNPSSFIFFHLYTALFVLILALFTGWVWRRRLATNS
ncbi:hypothetical protein [Pseudochryseolinea flava]|uniref:Linalool dehydratase/isomerase domain-containing protein n=1 Tax=Pseudochryseolinea flava TaxID=2059302 RepID=A0A364Y542_9BACT|nr:hypothetical protein [Pseudochryseolinea flava]RAW01191.1 hypothetical protein DQQ10_09755 [Pseudochryseolinea flava]